MSEFSSFILKLNQNGKYLGSEDFSTVRLVYFRRQRWSCRVNLKITFVVRGNGTLNERRKDYNRKKPTLTLIGLRVNVGLCRPSRTYPQDIRPRDVTGTELGVVR